MNATCIHEAVYFDIDFSAYRCGPGLRHAFTIHR